MFQGVIFDFDGVIVDSHPVHKRAWQRFLNSVGKVASEEELQFVLDGRTRNDILRHFLGELDTETIVEYGHRKEQLFWDEAGDVQAIQGLMTFLESLQEAQISLGIASSGSRGRINFLLGRLELLKYFCVVVSGDDVTQGKPHPAVFLKAAERLRRKPCELVAFEDAVSGVKAASSAGMTCIGIAPRDRASSLFEAGASFVAPDFRSLTLSVLQHMLAS